MMAYVSLSKRLLKRMALGSGVPQLVSRCLPKGIAILRYHSILNEGHDLGATIGSGIIHTARTFEAHVKLIAERYRPVTLDQVYQFLADGASVPERAVAFTFDDGFRDNYSVAAPILERYGIRAAFYLTTGPVATGSLPWFCRLRHAFNLTEKAAWVDSFTNSRWDLSDEATRRTAFRETAKRCAQCVGERQEQFVLQVERSLDAPPLRQARLMMNWDECRALRRAGHIIGSHAVTHPNLAYVSRDDALRELTESKRVLEEQLGESVVHFSYPSPTLQPHWTARTLALTKAAGYKTAVTCTVGLTTSARDPLSLPRLGSPPGLDGFHWRVESTFFLPGRRRPVVPPERREP